MMRQKQLVPKRRFEGFYEEWEEIKLREVVEFNPASVLPEIFEYVDLESVTGTDLINHRKICKNTAPSRAQRLAMFGDVFYQTVRPYQKNNFLYELPYNNFVFSTGYAQMRPNIDSHFLLNRIQEGSFVLKVLDRCTGTGYPAINSNDLANIKIKIPNNRLEQQKIGQFFKHLDEMIRLEQRKIDKTKALKSAYLAEMFPAEGERVPKRRFAGFTDDWKEYNLKEVGSIQSGSGFPEKEQGGIIGTPFFKVSDMNSAGNENELLTANNYVSEEQIQRVKWQPITILPAIVFAKVGAALLLNRKRLIRNTFLIDNNLMAYSFHEFWNVNFGKVLFETLNLPKYAQVGALPSYNGSEIEGIVVNLPEPKEQKLIGDLFKQLDDVIMNHQRKLYKLQATKQAYLHEMFV